MSISYGSNFDTSQLAARGFATQLEVISNNEDITPPEISDFSFTPTIIDTTNGSQDVTVTVRVKDARSGVRFVGVDFFLRGSYNRAIYINLDSNNRISGDDKDGVYQKVVTFSRNIPSGIYDVSVGASDVFGNGMYLDSAKLATRGYPSQLTIIGAPLRPRRTRFPGLGGF